MLGGLLHRRRRRQTILLLLAMGLVVWHYVFVVWPSQRPLGTNTSRGGAIRGGTSVSALTKKGDCWYQPTPFDLCVEGGELFLFSSDRDDVENVNLCVGYPQQKPEGTFVKLYHRRQPSDQLGSMFDSAKRVQLDVEFRTGYFITTTLETNIFHVLRDNLANVADMITTVGGSYGEGRVFLLPKNPRLAHVNDDRFHFLFSALTGVEYQKSSQPDALVTPLSSIPETNRVCFKKALVGQPFSGYSNGPPGRLAPLAKSIRKVYNVIQYQPSVRPVAAKLKVLMIERAAAGEINRNIGNAAEIAKIAERMEMVVKTRVLQQYSVVDQMTMASEADIIIGAHGQGLSWCIFMTDNSICLELQIWNDHRPDYRLLSKWSNIHNIVVPLTSPSQVSFSKADFTDDQKISLAYYRPISNLQHRQYQTIFPNISLVEEALIKSKSLLYGHTTEPYGYVDPETEREERERRRARRK